jgi:hypothetical protein
MKKMRWGFCLAIVSALTLCAYALTPISLGVGLPVKYELPAGFKGWFVHRAHDPLCPPLERRGVYWIVRVGKDGIACSSNPLPRKWRVYIFESVAPDGTRRKLESPWGHTVYRSRTYSPYPGATISVSTSDDEVGPAWFVGTRAELDKAGYTAPYHE